MINYTTKLNDHSSIHQDLYRLYYYKVQQLLFIIAALCLYLVFVGGREIFDAKKTALERTYSYSGKVLIVGAGASGLAAAKVLEQII